MILCDIGNTTFSFYDTKKKKNYKINIADIKDFDKFKNKTIHYISVNKKATKLLKKSFKNCIDLEINLNFTTKYSGMGVDRKVICNHIKNGIIINAGSAITIDVMSDNKHLGGTILLGLNSIKRSYPQISKVLKSDFKIYNNDTLPQNTNEAINYAITNMIAQPIQNIINQYQSISTMPIYITGGDGKIIYDMIYDMLNQEFTNLKYNPNLIFKAMQKIKL